MARRRHLQLWLVHADRQHRLRQYRHPAAVAPAAAPAAASTCHRGTVTAANSIVAGNSAERLWQRRSAEPDIAAATPRLAAAATWPTPAAPARRRSLRRFCSARLQYNGIGATVETMIPLPGSPAICAGPGVEYSLRHHHRRARLPAHQHPATAPPALRGRGRGADQLHRRAVCDAARRLDRKHAGHGLGGQRHQPRAHSRGARNRHQPERAQQHRRGERRYGSGAVAEFESHRDSDGQHFSDHQRRRGHLQRPHGERRGHGRHALYAAHPHHRQRGSARGHQLRL